MATQGDYGFSTPAKAKAQADSDHPVNLKLLTDVSNMLNYEITTRDDYRWFVLFNLLLGISRKVDNNTDSAYLVQIQENILTAANLFLGKDKALVKK